MWNPVYFVESLGSFTLEIIFTLATHIIDMKLYESLLKGNNAITILECVII